MEDVSSQQPSKRARTFSNAADPERPAKRRSSDLFTVRIRDRDFKISQASLNQDSPNYFTTAFQGDFEEAAAREITIPDRSPLLFEKYIIEHLAGYRLDLAPITDVELDNLHNDADFYMLDRLKATVANELQSRKVSNCPVLQERFTWIQGDIHPFSTVLEESDNESDSGKEYGSYDIDLHNVCLNIVPPSLSKFVPGQCDPMAHAWLHFVVSSAGHDQLHRILNFDEGSGMDLSYMLNARTPAGSERQRLRTADTFVCLEDRGRQFNGTLYDLWQGLWFITTGITPEDPQRRGYRNFLEFCDVDDKTFAPDAERGIWSLFAMEWICTLARVQVRQYVDGADSDIGKVYSLRACSMSDWRKRDLRWKAQPEKTSEDVDAS